MRLLIRGLSFEEIGSWETDLGELLTPPGGACCGMTHTCYLSVLCWSVDTTYQSVFGLSCIADSKLSAVWIARWILQQKTVHGLHRVQTAPRTRLWSIQREEWHAQKSSNPNVKLYVCLCVIRSGQPKFRYGPPNCLILVEETQLYFAAKHVRKCPNRRKLTIDVDNTVIVKLRHISFNDDKSSFECAFPFVWH